MVVFGSASAALACGVAMQQGVEQDNRKLGTGAPPGRPQRRGSQPRGDDSSETLSSRRPGCVPRATAGRSLLPRSFAWPGGAAATSAAHSGSC